MNKAIIFLALVGAVVLSACSASAPAEPGMVQGREVRVDGGSYRDVSADELQAMMQDKDFVLINVHVPFAGNIPGTDLSIPYNQIEANQAQLPAEKDAKILVYCRSGAMSAAAAQTLVNMGYTNVWNLSGGMNAWQRSGMSLDMTP